MSKDKETSNPGGLDPPHPVNVEERGLDRVVVAQGPLPLHQAIDYVIQAARDLKAAHARGIIHGDLKPGKLILDRAGMIRVLDLGLAGSHDANNPFNQTAAGRLTQRDVDMGTVDYTAPEQSEEGHCLDHRADIYSLGCTLYFLLTGREPFPGKSISERLMAHRERAAPSLRESRPHVPWAVEACYQKMMSKRPDDRPASMTEVITRLQASQLSPETVTERSAPPEKTRPDRKTINETPVPRTGPAKTEREPAIFPRREEREGLAINHDFNLEDLAIDVRSTPPPAGPRRARTKDDPRGRGATPVFRGLLHQPRPAILALAATGVLLAAFAGFLIFRPSPDRTEDKSRPPVSHANPVDDAHPVQLTTPTPAQPEQKTIFDGTSGKGWMLCNRAPVPPQNFQADGLNPHRTGSYLVVYEQKLGDFQLHFDYKLSRGCNSGVFLRVSDLNNPVHTGIEVALDDARHDDDHDSGALNGLVAPTIYAQKPSGEWNHMTITALGRRVAVSLNGTEVTSVDLDLWTVPGKRPDGSDHSFKDMIVGRLARFGYVGFQDLGGDCWFKNIVLSIHPASAGRLPPSSAASRKPTLTSTGPPGARPVIPIGLAGGQIPSDVGAVRLLSARGPESRRSIEFASHPNLLKGIAGSGQTDRIILGPSGLSERSRRRRSAKESFHTEIFINVGPVNPKPSPCDPPVCALLRRGIKKSGIPQQRHGDRASVKQADF
jgi:hypothetical protein